MDRTPARACDPNPDPLGLAGPHTVFINNCTTGTGIVSSNQYTREQAMNPHTPFTDLFGLRLNASHSKLKSATTADPIGDTVYIRGGTYSMPMISVWNRLVFWNEHGISIKAYPGEEVIIRGSSFLPGGVPPNTLCHPVIGDYFCSLNLMLQFWHSNNVTVEGITFVGNTPATIQINGVSVTGNLYQPYMLQFNGCNRLTLRNLTIRDFVSAGDIGLGHRYELDAVYRPTEYYSRGLTVSYSTGLEMDNVRVSCSPDDPSPTVPSTLPWNIVGFITESISGTPENPVRIHDCYFGECHGNAVELSTVTYPQANILFDHNIVDNWNQGIQIGGSGLTRNLEISGNRITYNHAAPSALNFGSGIRLINSDQVRITNNVIYRGDHYGSGIQLSACESETGQRIGVNDTLIAYNTLYRAGARAIALSNEPNLDGTIPLQNLITRTRVVNNLVYQLNDDSAQATNLNNNKRELFLQFLHFEDNQGYGNTFLNNLFVPSRSDGKAVGSADFGKWLLNGSTSVSWQCYVNPTIAGCSWHTCGPDAGCEIPTRYKYDATGFNLLQPYAQNNLNATSSNPMFVNVVKNDYQLVQGSPAINRAVYLPEVPTDANGVFRANGGGCTIGAHEYDPIIPLRLCDLNCDNQINSADIQAMITALVNTGQYLSVYGCIENGDMNHDGRLDGRDLRGFVDRLTP